MIPYPSLLTSTSQVPVLLICTSAVSTQRSEVDQLLENARSALNPIVQIMRVSEITHPEVVRSFGFTALPAFVLLQRGQELWRYAGLIDSTELCRKLSNQLEQTSLKTL